MIEIILWIQSNWALILQIISGIISVSTLIVKATPTLKDDHILKKVIKFTGKYLALNR